jgi:hypothetical protein
MSSESRSFGRRLVVAAVCLPGLLAAPEALAAVSCSVSAVGPAFGVYSPAGASAALANGSITATCTLLSGGTTTVNLVSSYSTGASGT